MGKVNLTDREKALQLYKDSKGTMQLIDIAKALQLPEGTVRAWKYRDKWADKIKKNAALQQEKEKDCSVAAATKNNVALDMKLKIPKLMIKNSKLTDKQQLFCIYYLKYFNATKAYQKAYECEYLSARNNGSRLLAHDGVRAEITRLKENKMNRAMLSPDDIFQKYIDIAFSDITDFATFGTEEVPVMGMSGPVYVEDENGDRTLLTKIINTVKFSDSTEVDGQLINEIKVGRDGAAVKLHDKMKALEWLARHCNLLSDEMQNKIKLEQSKLEIDRERLVIDKLKNGGNNDDDDDTGVIILADIIEDQEDQEIQESGEHNE